MKFILIMTLCILLASCQNAEPVQPLHAAPHTIPVIAAFERGAVGTGEIVAVDGGLLGIGQLHTLALAGEGLVVVCAVERLPDGRARVIEIELAGDTCTP